MAAPTQQELKLIEQLRGRLIDLNLTEEQKSSMELVRWLRAREHNLEEAEALFRKIVKYADEIDLKNILSWRPSEELQRMAPVDFGKHARDQTPVLIFPFGHWDVKGVVEKGIQEDLCKYVHFCLAKAMESVKGKVTAEGVPFTQIIAITDTRNVSVGQFMSFKVIQCLKATAPHFLDYEPERVKVSIYLNVGKLFTTIHGLMKPILTQRTRDKVHLFGGPDEWQPQLRSIMDDDQIPECYGGTADSIIHALLGHVYTGST